MRYNSEKYRFVPEYLYDLPGDIFEGQIGVQYCPPGGGIQYGRFFINKCDECQVLVFTDGTCAYNGSTEAEATWRVMVHPKSPYNFSDIDNSTPIAEQAIVHSGPLNDGYIPTSMRAKMTAVIKALRFFRRERDSSNFDTIVIATDLELIVDGMSGAVWLWQDRDWCTRAGNPVANVDLWQEIIRLVFSLENKGIDVKFWKVPRIKCAWA